MFFFQDVFGLDDEFEE